MKRCPECERTYSDDTLQFCLEDGTELISEGETSADETLVMSAPPEGTDNQELATTKASSKETETKTESASAAKAGKSPQGSKSFMSATTKALIVAAVAILFAAGVVLLPGESGGRSGVKPLRGDAADAVEGFALPIRQQLAS